MQGALAEGEGHIQEAIKVVLEAGASNVRVRIWPKIVHRRQKSLFVVLGVALRDTYPMTAQPKSRKTSKGGLLCHQFPLSSRREGTGEFTYYGGSAQWEACKGSIGYWLQ